MGRADAMIGAIEGKKAEGVLHIHMFLFLQLVHQHENLSEIAEMIQQNLISVDQFKSLINHVRCAWYPDVDKFAEERAEIDRRGPHMLTTTLCAKFQTSLQHHSLRYRTS